MEKQALDERCVNAIRFLAADMIQEAGSGHPGLPLGAAPMAYVLWDRHLKHNPKNPGWFDRDRFVLSAGHGSALLYALLHLTGYDLPLSELQGLYERPPVSGTFAREDTPTKEVPGASVGGKTPPARGFAPPRWTKA